MSCNSRITGAAPGFGSWQSLGSRETTQDDSVTQAWIRRRLAMDDGVDDEIRAKRLRMLEAYAEKKVKQAHRVVELRKLESTQRILPLSPMRPKAKNGQEPPRIKNKWWLKQPCKPGEACTRVQCKLSSEEFFTGTQKTRKHDENIQDTFGDIIRDGKEHGRVVRLVSNVSATNLAAHRAGADLHSEMNFRVHLRESCNV